MPAIATRRFRIHNAEQFFESLTEGVPTRYFIFIGRVTPFSDENNPPTPSDTVQNTEFDAFRDIISLKRIQASDVSHVIPRYNWTSGTVYKQYTDTDSSLYPSALTPTSNTTFYVMTEDHNVYKCIDNNRGTPSTIKPTGISTSIVTTSDNYRWKFMYRISAAEALKFLTTNYIPVKTLTTDDNSAQWDVQAAASNGAINHIVINANGSNYVTTSNLFFAVTNSTVVRLATDASGSDDHYNKSTIYISAGLGAGQLRRIINYVAATRTVTVNGAFVTTPNTSSRYIIGPNVIIRGDSGQSSSLRATAYVSNCGGGQIRKITMVASGFGYSTANVTISANQGSGATCTPIISPPGGHGADPIDELAGHNIMVSVQLSGNESNTFPSNNDFRVIGMLRDPLLRSGPAANSAVIDQCTRLTVSGLSGDFTADEVIIGSTSGAKARFVRIGPEANLVRVLRVTTNGNGIGFTAGEVITGGTSGVTATISTVTQPACRLYSGDVLYIENRIAITRNTSQLEDIKVVYKF